MVRQGTLGGWDAEGTEREIKNYDRAAKVICPPVPAQYRVPGGPTVSHVAYQNLRYEDCAGADQTAEFCAYEAIDKGLRTCEQTLGVVLRIAVRRAGTVSGSPAYDIGLSYRGVRQIEFLAVDTRRRTGGTTTHRSRYTSCKFTDPQRRFPYVENLRETGTTCFEANVAAYFGADAYIQRGLHLTSFRLADGQRWSAKLNLDVDGDDNQYVAATFRSGRATVTCDFVQEGQG